jgi:transcriptional regulator with XRE-family HTH domain
MEIANHSEYASFIGTRIFEERKAQEMSRYRLAQLSGVPVSRLKAFEECKSVPRSDTLNAIFKALGFEVIEII